MATQLVADLTRLIPAHAGKTRGASMPCVKRAAHPRSRGENGAAGRRRDDHDGSSPLTRGKHSLRVLDPTQCRLIPAHAGKTSRIPTFGRCTPAHPRSRGENFVAAMYALGLRGSSPLTRGKRSRRYQEVFARRLIPAHAGKTARPQSRSRAPAAHPRSRGENSFRRDSAGIKGGSSPLTRGKPPRVRRAGGQQRLIPAHAGKTPEPICANRRNSAHPRSRGENTLRQASGPFLRGSSPLTRGKLRA